MQKRERRGLIFLGAVAVAAMAALFVLSRSGESGRATLAGAALQSIDRAPGGQLAGVPEPRAPMSTAALSGQTPAASDVGAARAAATLSSDAPRAFRVRFHVIERGDGAAASKPVAGVEITRATPSGAERELRSDYRDAWTADPSNGQGQLTWSIPGEYVIDGASFDFKLEREGFVPARLTVRPWPVDPLGGDVAGPAPVELQLQRSAAVRLVVAGGAPSDRGRVLAWFRKDGRSGRPDVSVEWKGEREVQLADLTPGPLAIALIAKGRPAVTRQALFVTAGETQDVDIELGTGEIASGVVLDLDTSQPVPGVRIAARPEVSGLDSYVERAPFDPVVTDGRGRFEIRGLPQGKIELELATLDGAKHVREVLVLEGNASREHRLKVRGSARLTGRVDLASGARKELDGLPGLELVVTTRDVAERHRRRDSRLSVPRSGVRADVQPDGTFSFDHVPSGRELMVQARCDGSAVAYQLVPALKLGDVHGGVELELTAAPAIRFRVRAPGSEPFERMDVRLGGRDAGGRGRRAGGTLEPVEVQGSVGTYEVLAEFERPESIRLRATGFLDLNEPWPEGTSEPEFELVEALRLIVEVRGSHGLAVPSAYVRANTLEPAPEASGGNGSSGARPTSAKRQAKIDARAARKARKRRGPGDRADRYGRAKLDLNPELPWTVDIDARGYRPVRDLEVPAGAGRIVLQAEMEPVPPLLPATVRGTAVRAGSGGALPSLRFDGLRGGSAAFDGTEFELVGLPPGNRTIVLHSDGYESVRLPLSAPLRPGEVLDVGELRVRGATRVEVKVVDAEGKAIRNARVRLQRLPPAKGGREGLPKELRFPDRASRDGTYRRDNVPRTTWRLVVERKGYKRVIRNVKVAGGRFQERVQLAPRGS